MEAAAELRWRSIARIGALCVASACSGVFAAAVDDAQRAIAQISAEVDRLVVQASILSELLRIREAAGEMNAAGHQQNLGAAVSQLRSAPETMPVAFLKRERVAAAQRLIAAAESQIAVARWPTDRPGPYYVQLSRLAMDDAHVRLAYLSGLDASLVEASRRAAEVLGWTQGRLGGGSVFDGLDEEIEAVTKAVVTQLPRPPMPSSTVAAAPGAAGSPPSPNPTQTGSTPAPPTPSARSGREVTIADPMARGYRLDRCLHWGQQCDEPAATAWCRTQGYQKATHWQWRHMRPTLVMGDNLVCDGDYCGAFTTITCTDQPDVTQAQPAAPRTPGAGQFLGCFSDQGDPNGTQGRDLNGYVRRDSGMTIGLCVQECGARGFAYAGLQYSTYCFCGNTYGKSGQAANCDTKCGGNPAETCGGSWANSVHATGAAAAVGPGSAAVQPQPATATPGAVAPARPPQTPRPPTPAGVPLQGNPGFGPWQVGMDVFDGADYRNFPIPTADPATCLAECARDARCRAVTYTMPGTYGAAQAACWLKAQTGRFGPHASAISAVKIDTTKPARPVATPPAAMTPSLTGQWNGPLGVYEMAQTGNNFTWRIGGEIGQGTISGDNLQVTWTGGGSATGRITARTPQGLPIAIDWNNGVGFRRVGY